MRITGIAQREYELFEVEDSHLGSAVERFFDGKWAVMARKPDKCPVCQCRPWRWATAKEKQELDAIYQRWKDSPQDEAQPSPRSTPPQNTSWEDVFEKAMTPIEKKE